jgi:aldose 1-epimerase
MTMEQYRKQFSAVALGFTAAVVVGCTTLSPTAKSTTTHAPFGQMPDGRPVEIYTLRNARGAEARIMTYGGFAQPAAVPVRGASTEPDVPEHDRL